MAGSERKLTVVIAGDAKGAVGALGSLDKATETTGSKFQAIGKKAGIAFAAIGGAALVGGKQAIDAASNLNETLSKSNTVFGSSAKAIENWSNSAAKGIGQSKQQALEAASSFGNMFTQLGIGEKQAAGMSTKMTELASDFASFHNADISEVLNAQQAAFRGEYDAVQRFVPTINAAAVEQKALAMGLKGTAKELTAQDKALATQQLLLEGAGAAAGDFARTSGGLANQQRILSAQFEDVKAKIGEALIPIMQKLVGVAAQLIQFFSENEGALIALAAVVGTVLVTAFVAWAASLWATVGALTVLGTPVIAIVAAVAALAAGVIYAYTHWDAFRTAVDAVAQFLTGTLWPALQTVAGFIVGTVIPVVARLIGFWVDLHVKGVEAAGGVIKAFTGVVSFFASMPGKIASAASGMWNGIVAAFKAAINAIIDMWNGIRFPSLTIGGQDPLGDFGPSLPKVTIGGWDLPNIPRLAEGAMVKRRPGGILANIGEGRFDEAVIPLKRGVALGGQAQPATIILQVDGQTLARLMVDNLTALGKSDGIQYLNAG